MKVSNEAPSFRLIRWPEVKVLTGISRVTAWRMEKNGKFPRRRKLGENSVAWIASEVEAWLESRQVVGGGMNHDAV